MGLKLINLSEKGADNGLKAADVVNAGIRPVLLQRGHMRCHDDVDTADDLEQVLELIFKRS